MKHGVWCHECETVTLEADLGWDDEWEWTTCNQCLELEPGLWEIRGENIYTGMHVTTGSEELWQLLKWKYEDE